MTAVFPSSTNHQYQGSGFSAGFLTLYGMAWILPGMVHSFLPDGGAGVIAGLDVSRNPTMIVGLFAWAGATQIAHGVVTVAVGIRYRTLVPLFLLVSLVERTLLSWSGWVRHLPIDGHHPPQHYASLILIPLISLFLWLSLRPAKGEKP